MLYICILSNKFDLKQTIRVLHNRKGEQLKQRAIESESNRKGEQLKQRAIETESNRKGEQLKQRAIETESNWNGEIGTLGHGAKLHPIQSLS